ncbi:redoxin domain-containing protein [Mycoplasmopsis cricetuli]|uniref:redoxin domain-containing protein n=1 Tax=Mycoplasmopsis cricetuli TaxID=171283 RepID=UPI0004721B7B|nr:redoxin domain-containing protein [Mycoplasmopsis cricetuli]
MKKVIFSQKEYDLIGTPMEIGKKVQIKSVLAGTFDQKEYQNEGKYTILSFFPAIDTSVCDLQISQTDEIAKNYPKFKFISISVDLPTTLKVYVEKHNVQNVQMYSDYKDRSVTKSLGLLIDDLFLAARAVIVLDKENKIIYKQMHQSIHEQIDFKALQMFLDNLE